MVDKDNSESQKRFLVIMLILTVLLSVFGTLIMLEKVIDPLKEQTTPGTISQTNGKGNLGSAKISLSIAKKTEPTTKNTGLISLTVLPKKE